MLLRLDLQFFASKKGVGSTRNGRDSQSQSVLALNVQTVNSYLVVLSFTVNAVQKFTQVKTLAVAEMTLYLQKSTVLLNSNVLVVTAKK